MIVVLPIFNNDPKINSTIQVVTALNIDTFFNGGVIFSAITSYR